MNTRVNVKCGRTENFDNTAHALSNFIESLKLGIDENDKLINLAVEHVNAAEHNAFVFGFETALKLLGDAQKQGNAPSLK